MKSTFDEFTVFYFIASKLIFYDDFMTKFVCHILNWITTWNLYIKLITVNNKQYKRNLIDIPHLIIPPNINFDDIF